ncbi:sulfur carrier protein ThiS [Saccharopolyspora taberi]|uniref:Sulfur carrier protein ThiS n=1 Tax=Saccharopolyspora taberi TaxID=60895 RepID=A0ABN3V059_9PSEU
MNVTVNGKRHDVPEGCTAGELMDRLELPRTGVAIAVDGAVLPKARWASALADGAAVEVLTAVQGG